jgi:RNA-directed DNA polymerase
MALVERMSAMLNLPEAAIQSWGGKASHAYKTYTVRKRNGEPRTVHHPAKALKAMQRWLAREIISAWPVHTAASAYRRGLGIKENAEYHAGHRYLLRMDLVDFFPSIRESDIRNFLRRHPPRTVDWTDGDRTLFTRLVCREGRLTIGAPTSPCLSNALCHDLDSTLAAAAAREGIAYSRYADDMFFSTTTANILGAFQDLVERSVAECALPAELRVNRRKTRHTSRKRRQVVTGVVISNEGRIGIGRSRKRFLRGQLHRWNDLSPADRRRLGGRLAFARHIDPEFINALVLKYGHERVAAALRGE